MDTPEQLRRLSRVYGPATWDVYDRLDRGLDPCGPDWLHAKAAQLLRPGARVLDAGCRDAEHLIRLVRDNDVTGVGVEPVTVHAERAHAAVATAGLSASVRIVTGTVEDWDEPNAAFELIWCRDVLEQVDRLRPFLTALGRVLRPGGSMLAYTTVTTDLLEPGEARLLRGHLGNVFDNLAEPHLTAAFAATGWQVVERVAVGTQWREYAEERTHPMSTALLRLARLRRDREAIVAEHGADIVRHVEANLHWELFQFLGKLLPVVYLLRR